MILPPRLGKPIHSKIEGSDHCPVGLPFYAGRQLLFKMEESEKKLFFDRTLQLANLGWGNTHPNPMVGAVIVEEGEIVAEGYHKLAGSPHAEVEAIRRLGRTPKKGASIFVSLEPCSTTGRTPPCVQGILDAGIRKVYIGATDPNPYHSGRGIEILRNREYMWKWLVKNFNLGNPPKFYLQS